MTQKQHQPSKNPNPVKLTNPLLTVLDISGFASIAKTAHSTAKYPSVAKCYAFLYK